MDGPRTVESGYDRMAAQYLAAKRRDDPATLAALETLTRDLPHGAAVLDLGCGAGVPATAWLARRFAVTGVDVSAAQLVLAQREAPGATLIKASMTEVTFPPRSFAAVVALYSIIHVPRTEHPALLERIHGWLKPNGGFLATWPVHAWEGREEDWEGWGAPMWWSHHDGATYLALLEQAGFHIVSTETPTTAFGQAEETWLWVLARACPPAPSGSVLPRSPVLERSEGAWP